MKIIGDRSFPEKPVTKSGNIVEPEEWRAGIPKVSDTSRDNVANDGRDWLDRSQRPVGEAATQLMLAAIPW